MVHLSETRPPVLTKRDMYARLAAGEFGNTLPQWFSVADWMKDPLGYDKYELWGVRSLKSADPRARLNCRRDDVFGHLHDTGLIRDGYQISAMVDAIGGVQAELQCCIAPLVASVHAGLYVEGQLAPVAGNWRPGMRQPRTWEGSRADAVLRQVLNDNSYDDVRDLIALYPDHVVEFTAMDVCLGTLPGRNAVVWEVRRY